MKYLAAFVFVASLVATSSNGSLHTANTHHAVSHAVVATTTTSTTDTTVVVQPPKPPAPTPMVVTPEEARWDTQSTDHTAYWPLSTSPLTELPYSAQVTFACLRYVESRNHLTSVSYSGAGGLYQFMPLIWAHFGGLAFAPTPEQATGAQQDQVAVNVYTANHGFYPEWQDPLCGT